MVDLLIFCTAIKVQDMCHLHGALVCLKKKEKKKERQRPMTTMKIPADSKIMIISPIKITSFESSSLLLVVK